MTIGIAEPMASSLQADQEGHRTYQSSYRVESDDKYDGPATVSLAAGLPSPGTFYAWGNDIDTEAYAWRRPSVSLMNDSQAGRKLWRVIVTHSTRPQPRCTDAQLTPLDEPPKMGGSFVERQGLLIIDSTGRDVVNTAGDPFVPALEYDIYDDTAWITFNSATINLATRAQYVGTVNDATFWGLAARSVKLKAWTWEIGYYGQCYPYIANRLEFHIKYDKFLLKPRNEGFRKLVAGVVSEILIKGERPSTPVALTVGGDVLAVGDPVVYFDGAGGNPDPFEAEGEEDFSALNLPNLPLGVS